MVTWPSSDHPLHENRVSSRHLDDKPLYRCIIAAVDGPTTEDLAVAFVWDFGTDEAFHVVRGGGAFLNGKPVEPLVDKRLIEDGRLELACIETSDARRTTELAVPLAHVAYRWRILDSIAVAPCQVATQRVDAMVNVTRCRIVDAAAGR